MLHDTARTLAALRAEGRTVLVHCVQATSRTPTLAIAHATLNLGVPLEQAIVDVRRVLPDANPNPGFTAALHRLAGDKVAGGLTGRAESSFHLA